MTQAVSRIHSGGPGSHPGQFMWDLWRTCFSPSSYVFPCQYHSTAATHTISSGGRTTDQLEAAVQRQSYAIDMSNKVE
jgi:hypothetical protein